MALRLLNCLARDGKLNCCYRFLYSVGFMNFN